MVRNELGLTWQSMGTHLLSTCERGGSQGDNMCLTPQLRQNQEALAGAYAPEAAFCLLAVDEVSVPKRGQMCEGARALLSILSDDSTKEEYFPF